MKLLICAVRDREAACFGQPFFIASLGNAIRSFGDLINDPNSKDVVSKHPGDFDLFHLGTWDDEFSKFDLLPDPRQIAVGKDLVRPIRE